MTFQNLLSLDIKYKPIYFSILYEKKKKTLTDIVSRYLQLHLQLHNRMQYSQTWKYGGYCPRKREH